MRDEVDLQAEGYTFERDGVYWHVYRHGRMVAVSFWRTAAEAVARRHCRRHRLSDLFGIRDWHNA